MAQDGINQRIRQLTSILLAPGNQTRTVLVRALLIALVATSLVTTGLLLVQRDTPDANAQALRISSAATCGQLARVDPTVTNGSSWGRAILPGHGAPGGWFGVDVCSNGFNSVNPNGSNVSCDSLRHGCSPTTDGYGWTFQCPELIVRFSAWAFGDNPGDWGRTGWGNAPDLWLPANHPSDFVMYRNGSATPPVPGDILVWGFLDSNGNPWPAGPDGSHGGHIAVVAAVHGTKVITAEQNVKWGSQDHPSDTLALTKVGSRWILSGSSRPATSLPTWRWLRTMGHSRGTFGWLHSVKNNGHFPNKHASSTTSAKKSSSAKSPSQQFPGGLPSLSTATVITRSGTLADLTWSTQSLFAPTADGGQPQAQVRSLGIPPGNVRLATGQAAATLLLSDGSRYTYALGTDGNLYLARTTPSSLGVFWSELGQPARISLVGSPVASLFAGGVQIAARGTDGNLWWRAGPADHLGNWISLGAPAATSLSGGLALAGAPGTGSPVAYAVGDDGRLYTRIWQDMTTAADGTQIPAAWSDWLALGAQPTSSHLTSTLLVVPELPNAHSWIGPWPDSPLNVFAADSNGALWWFRSTRLSTGYSATVVTGGSAQVSSLLGGVAVAAATNSTTSGPQVETIQLYVASRSASYLTTLTLPGAAKSAPVQPAWVALPDPPAGLAATSSGAAVALGPGNSVLVAAAGDDVVIGGLQTMTAALLPAIAPQASGGKKAANPWMRVGAAPAAATFSDPFTTSSLDSRWTRSDSTVRARMSSHGLSLTPGAQGVAALMQTASAGDVTLTVQVARPDTLPARASVGLLLYDDDADWLTLTVDRGGLVSLCPMVQQTAQSCITQKATATSAIGLRLERSGSTFTASFSNDQSVWQHVGQWTPTLAGTPGSATQQKTATPGASGATPTPAATATPQSAMNPGANYAGAPDPAAAPLAFTSWGVIAMGSGSATGWPRLTNFTLTPVA